MTSFIDSVFAVVDKLKATYDAVQFDPSMPVRIKISDFEALSKWHVIHPIEDGPRVLTSDKILNDDGSMDNTTITAFQIMAFNIAFANLDFQKML